MSVKGHYLYVQTEDFERVYFLLAREDETAEEALDRYLDEKVKGRKRNVQKAREQARARVAWTRICRPSSWHAARREAGTDDAPKPRRRK